MHRNRHRHGAVAELEFSSTAAGAGLVAAGLGHVAVAEGAHSALLDEIVAVRGRCAQPARQGLRLCLAALASSQSGRGVLLQAQIAKPAGA